MGSNTEEFPAYYYVNQNVIADKWLKNRQQLMNAPSQEMAEQQQEEKVKYEPQPVVMEDGSAKDMAISQYLDRHITVAFQLFRQSVRETGKRVPSGFDLSAFVCDLAIESLRARNPALWDMVCNKLGYIDEKDQVQVPVQGGQS